MAFQPQQEPPLPSEVLPSSVIKNGRASVHRLMASTHGVFAASVTIRVGGALLALVVNILLARLLGVAEYGRYMTLLSASLLLGVLAVRGANVVLTREFASREPAWRPTVTRWAAGRVSRSAVLAFAVFLLWLAYNNHSQLQAPFAMDAVAGVLLIGLATVGALQTGALNGLGASLRSQALPLLVKNSGLLLALGVLFWLLSGPTSAGQALTLQVAGYLLAFAIGSYWLRPTLAFYAKHPEVEGLAPAADKLLTRQWVVASRSFMLVSIASILVNRLDVIIVSALADSETAGMYAAGARLAQVALMVALSVNIVLSPKFARAHAEKDIAAIRSLLRTGLAFTVPIAIIEAAVAVVFAPGIVTIFGHDYAQAAAPFIWVTLGYALWALAAPGYALLSMTGSEKVVAGLSWLVLMVNVAAMLLLVPAYGATGAAIAMVAGYAVVLPVLFMVNVKVLCG